MYNLHSFVKVATACFELQPGNVKHNENHIISLVKKGVEQNAELIVFPELCITGYTCNDMLLRKDLSDMALESVKTIAKCLVDIEGNVDPLVVVGFPYRDNFNLYNCAAYLYKGKILAIVPKTYLPNYNEFYEKRCFSSALDNKKDYTIIDDEKVPFTTDLIINTSSGMHVGCEICEDLWVSNPVSTRHCLNGANVIVNLSASNETVTKSQYRKNLVMMQSAKCNCAYCYVSSGVGESTTDVVFSGHNIIMQDGTTLVDKKQKFDEEELLCCALIDLEKIENNRIKMNSYRCDEIYNYHFIDIITNRISLNELPSYVDPYPFIPHNQNDRTERCKEVMSIQAQGLATRLKKIKCKKTVVGISGGLDSTLALLVIKEAYDLLHYSYKDIIAITMPGFGTTKLTKSSADRLIEQVGATYLSIDITSACKQHMNDIGQELDKYDVTYENIQARERTQILMDVANKVGGIVVGTGDLSELALGWCTYNGDHMSMYGVNSSVPKTLVRFIIETYAKDCKQELSNVLYDICNTTISPELVPPDQNGNIIQSTESIIGKYDLHDFFLFNYIRNGFSYEKIFDLALIAFGPLNIEKKKIEDTLNIFMNRFKTNQFKRSCLPDGPKVGSVSLSPRGDWRMPSDYQG